MEARWGDAAQAETADGIQSQGLVHLLHTVSVVLNCGKMQFGGSVSC